ncbi:MAG: 3-phosphoserine/phosphohydroxythreonine transaminase [Chitinophagales bacterium]
MLNFYSGPSKLAPPVFKELQQNLRGNARYPFLEISHRSKDVVSLFTEAEQLFRSLFNVPDAFDILFTHGGATLQFSAIPMNLCLYKTGNVGVINSGRWSTLALVEIEKWCRGEAIASSQSNHFNELPPTSSLEQDYDYIHICTNNTIHGTQFHTIPKLHSPLVADMSSEIGSRPIDWSLYNVVFAGFQKNLGSAGGGIVIVRREAIKEQKNVPSLMSYNNLIAKQSMWNTPPVFAVYSCLLTLRWMEASGGIAHFDQERQVKSNMLYNTLADCHHFTLPIKSDHRSHHNIVFEANEEAIEEKFLQAAHQADIVGLQGHRSRGGLRASVYNAHTLDEVEQLCEFINHFDQKV